MRVQSVKFLRLCIVLLAVLFFGAGRVSVAAEFGFSGLQIHGMTENIAKAMGLSKVKGVLVQDVELAGPADAAGIRRGDLITEFNGTKIDTYNRMIKAVTTTKPGQTVSVRVKRGDGEHKLVLKLGTRPESRKIVKGSVVALPTFGLTLASITAKIRKRFNIRWSTTGVLITLIDPEFEQRTEFRRGDIIVQVNQQPVWKPEQVRDAFEAAKKAKKKNLLMLVERVEGFHLFISKVR